MVVVVVCVCVCVCVCVSVCVCLCTYMALSHIAYLCGGAARDKKKPIPYQKRPIKRDLSKETYQKRPIKRDLSKETYSSVKRDLFPIKTYDCHCVPVFRRTEEHRQK